MILDIHDYVGNKPLAELYIVTTASNCTFKESFRAMSTTLISGWPYTSRKMFVVIPTGARHEN